MSFLSQVRSFVSRNARVILGMVVVTLIVHEIFGAHGFLAMRRSQKQIEQIRENTDRLNRENSDLGTQINSLKTDPQAIERIAREEMGLARPGEVIIKLPPPETNSAADSPSDSESYSDPSATGDSH